MITYNINKSIWNVGLIKCMDGKKSKIVRNIFSFQIYLNLTYVLRLFYQMFGWILTTGVIYNLIRVCSLICKEQWEESVINASWAELGFINRRAWINDFVWKNCLHPLKQRSTRLMFFLKQLRGKTWAVRKSQESSTMGNYS